MTRPARLLPIFTLLCFAAFYALFIAPSPALADEWSNDPNFSRSWQVKPQAEWEKIIKQCDNPSNPQLNSECFSGPYSLGSLLQTTLAIFQGSTTGTSPGISSIVTDFYATLFFSQPSSIDYLAYLGNRLNLSIAQPAYAQGVGATKLEPMIKIWATFRNLAYLIFVIILLVIGFMIMFRRKLDPQTVVGIQQALPRIVVALLLITFSYAIVGFMVDLMVLLTSTIAIVLANNFSLAGTARNYPAIIAITNQSFVELIAPIKNIGIPIGASIDAIIKNLLLDIPGLDWLVNLTVKWVLQLTIVIAVFKIFFMLLENYVHIILSLIFGPLQLTFAAIPGNKTVRSWIMNLLSHILVFPTTFTLIFIASIFTTQKTFYHPIFNLSYEKVWEGAEPTWNPPLLGGALQRQASTKVEDNVTPGQNLVGPLIAFGILIFIPQIGSLIKSQLEVKELPGGGIREQIGRGAGWVPFVGGLYQRALSS